MTRSLPLATLTVCVLLSAAAEPPKPKPAPTPAEARLMRDVSANDLRGMLSFLSSDLLEGRDTPSRGLDLAAEYIASEFRRAGLDPGGDDGYFQTAPFEQVTPVKDGFSLSLTHDGETAAAGPQDVSLSTVDALDLDNAPVFKLDLTDKAAVSAAKPEQVDGRVVVMQSQRRGMPGAAAAFALLQESKPALLVMVGEESMGAGGGGQRLVDPSHPAGEGMFSVPRILVKSGPIVELLKALPTGDAKTTATVHIAAPLTAPVKLRNVVAILRGSDPVRKDTCVMVTAHYDHVGMKPGGEGDRIFNGANDDGSGTVSVVEIARAFAASQVRPRRTVVFVAFFGEEKGDLGSHYYGTHSVFPIANTVADINLEQVGRTDSTEGPQLNNASLTGFGYSTVGDVLVKAGALTGVKIYKHPKNSDLYFSRSDNQALADVGVPAHTLCVAFDYPDYHGVGDEWPKVNYENMAKIDRTVALALLMLADDPSTPRWNPKEPKAARYLKAWRKEHPPAPEPVGR